MSVQPAAPAVVAVVVAGGGSLHLEETVLSLAQQDYPNLSVVVIDNSSESDVVSRVAAVARGVVVQRLDSPVGFSAAVDAALVSVQQTGYLLVSHDDVVYNGDAIRLLVEAALASNAGVAGPKLLNSESVGSIQSVGFGVDALGYRVERAEPDELDQGQLDARTEVFGVSSAAMLIRADLFRTLGGFDSAMSFVGDDLDICWRAWLLGARVVVAPASIATHQGALSKKLGRAEVSYLAERHRLRSVLRCYGWARLAVFFPNAVIRTVFSTVKGLATARVSLVRNSLGAWTWNLRHIGSLLSSRRRIQKSRSLTDAQIADKQAPSQHSLALWLQGRLEGAGVSDTKTSSRELVGAFWGSVMRATVVVWVAITLLIVLGSRHIIGEGVSHVSTLVPFSDTPRELLDHWGSGWRATGLGSPAVAPPVLLVMSALGFLLAGHMALLETLVFAAALPLGALGAWKCTRLLLGAPVDDLEVGRVRTSETGAVEVTGPVEIPIGDDDDFALESYRSRRRRSILFARGRTSAERRAGIAVARLVAPIIYLAVPLPYNAFARGSLRGLVLWVAAPWLFERLVSVGVHAPLGKSRAIAPIALSVGLITAVVAAFTPAAIVMLTLIAVFVTVTGLIPGTFRRDLQVLVAGAGGALVAWLLLLPWSADLMRKTSFPSISHGADGGLMLSVSDLLRFRTGPMGGTVLGFAILVPALLPLIIGQGWRLAWAIRLWSIAVGCWLLGVVAKVGPGSSLPSEAVLAPAALCLALSCALGLVAFEVDLPAYKFGWRQFASYGCGLAIFVSLIAPMGAAISGRWGQPSQGLDSVMLWLPDQEEVGPYRVAWVGASHRLPGDSSPLSDGLALGISRNGFPSLSQLWPSQYGPASTPVGGVIKDAIDGKTNRLGELLRPMAVRYVVLVNRGSPDLTYKATTDLPQKVIDGFESQLDLKRVRSDSAIAVYENVAAVPAVAQIPVVQGAQPGAGLASAVKVLVAKSPFVYSGPVSAGEIYLAETPSNRWQGTLSGSRVSSTRVGETAMAFPVEADGKLVLSYKTSLLRRALVVGQILLWVMAFVALRGMETSRRRSL